MSIKDVQNICLEILKDVHDFCLRNDIKYSLSGGSLLGAIRHNGFIPWDDDVDIQMPRPDYDRFIHLYKSDKGYRLFSREIDGGENVRVRLSKVCEMEKTYMEQGPYCWTDVEVGVGIDIIPVDGAPDSFYEANKHINMLIKQSRMVNAYRVKFASFSEIIKHDSFKQRLLFVLRKIYGYFVPNNCVMSLINLHRKYPYDTSSFFCAGIHYGIGEWQPKKNMETYILHKFEDAEFYIMSGYDANLRSLFGDYMKLPPEDKRGTHTFYRYYWKL